MATSVYSLSVHLSQSKTKHNFLQYSRQFFAPWYKNNNHEFSRETEQQLFIPSKLVYVHNYVHLHEWMYKRKTVFAARQSGDNMETDPLHY